MDSEGSERNRYRAILIDIIQAEILLEHLDCPRTGSGGHLPSWVARRQAASIALMTSASNALRVGIVGGSVGKALFSSLGEELASDSAALVSV